MRGSLPRRLFESEEVGNHETERRMLSPAVEESDSIGVFHIPDGSRIEAAVCDQANEELLDI
jgi:hypothetical protein